MRETIQILSYFLLFGLTFFVLPVGRSPFEVPKVFAAVAFITAASLLVFIKHHLYFLQGNILHKPKLIFSVLLASLAVYHLFSSAFSELLLWGNAWRSHGTILYLSLFLLFLVAGKLPFNISIFNKLSFYSLILLALFTLIIGPRGSFRFIGPLGEPSSLGAAVLFLYPLTTGLTDKKQKYISLMLSLVLIFLTGSRIPIVGFLMEICLLNIQRYRKTFSVGILALTTLLIFSAFTPFLPKNLPDEYFLRFEDRSQIWETSFIAAQQSPILGTGFGSAQDVIYKVAWDTSSFLRFQSVDHAHNIFLQWWIMAGPFGSLILLSLIILSIRNLYKSQSFVLLSILAGLLVVQLFNPVSVVTLVHFWWLLGIGFVQSQYNNHKRITARY